MSISVAALELAEFADGSPVIEDVHEESWLTPSRASIERLKAFDPDVVHLSHDRETLRRTP